MDARNVLYVGKDELGDVVSAAAHRYGWNFTRILHVDQAMKYVHTEQLDRVIMDGVPAHYGAEGIWPMQFIYARVRTAHSSPPAFVATADSVKVLDACRKASIPVIERSAFEQQITQPEYWK